MSIGEMVRLARRARGLSMEVCAVNAKTTYATMQRIESDKDVNLRLLRQVLDYLDLELIVQFKQETKENENENDFIETIDAEELEVVEP